MKMKYEMSPMEAAIKSVKSHGYLGAMRNAGIVIDVSIALDYDCDELYWEEVQDEIDKLTVSQN